MVCRWIVAVPVAAGAGRRCAGCGAGLSQPPGQHGRRGGGGRADRRVCAHHGRAHVAGSWPARRDRERRRRRRHVGRPARRAGRARRLHHLARDDCNARQSATADRQAAVRSGGGFHARRADRGNPADPDHAQGFSRQHVRGVRRLRQGEPGEDELRLGRRRLRRAPRLRDARSRHGHQHHPRSLSGHGLRRCRTWSAGGSIFSARLP